MIVPMKKYAFLLYHSDYELFLNEIRNLGVVHVIETEGSLNDQQIIEKSQTVAQIDKTLLFLNQFTPGDAENVECRDGLEIVSELADLQEKEEEIEQRIVENSKELALVEPWGDVKPDLLNKLSNNGIHVKLFTCSEKKFNPEWANTYALEIINRVGAQLYFAVFLYQNEICEIDAEQVKLPNRSLTTIRQEIDYLVDRREMIRSFYTDFAACRSMLNLSRSRLIDQIEELKVKLSTSHTAEDKLRILQGWVPVEKVNELNEYLDCSSAVYYAEDPRPDDKVPIMLRNNWFSRLFEPIGNLFSLPSYFELDLTVFFAPFYMLFFGLCMGDAGYGLFIFLAATLYKFRARVALKPILTLAQLLGVATILMGTISGTFFGFELVKIEGFVLKDIILNPLQLFYASLIIGLVQIVFGMVVRVLQLLKFRGLKYALSTIGWIILIIGLSLLKGGEYLGWFSAQLSKSMLIGIASLSLVLILIFNDPDAGLFWSIGKGLYDIYSNVTGVFGDMLSYIRLFALGISGAILGLVVNNIAASMLSVSWVGPILYGLFLIIGHSLVIALAALGAFVHPMRLTFVEFYKNAGFIGGGKEYKPFK